jgi:cytidylate kinase
MIVTIDGPAGSGKSTTARRLARELGFCFLDTGAMYRVVALVCINKRIDLDDARAAAEAARSIEMQFEGERVFSDGVDVSSAIRSAEVTQGASVVAVNSAVRDVLVERQREIALGLDLVTEGRDQGSVVFPHAECKIFLTASPVERARRRQQELEEQGVKVPFEAVLEQIRDRDERDANRAVAPLQPAPGAHYVDTTGLDADEVLARLVELVRNSRRTE